jgi:hypothetical protein
MIKDHRTTQAAKPLVREDPRPQELEEAKPEEVEAEEVPEVSPPPLLPPSSSNEIGFPESDDLETKPEPKAKKERPAPKVHRRIMPRVLCTVEHAPLPGPNGNTIDSTIVTCTRCEHVTESFGTSDASRRRCLAELRRECPSGEENFYVTEDDNPDEFVRSDN